MKFLILSENSNGTWSYLHYRSLGSHEIKKRVMRRGHQAHVIEWFTYWKQDELKQVISKYFQDTDEPVIATSTPFGNTDLEKLESVMRWAKDTFPNLKCIHGGNRAWHGDFKGLVDIVFLGRSMEMFEAWLDKKDLTPYKLQDDPIVVYNQNFKENIDTPVVPRVDPEDFYIPGDVLGFELGAGCKFNCLFCNYELRGSKISTIADPKELHEYFKEANSKYGVTHFFASDDTINETDAKLETLIEAIEGLNYKPKIAAFSRLDLITSRKRQMDLYKKIGFNSLFFGIESFNPEVSKVVRKKSGIDNIKETLKTFRQECPDTFTTGAIMVGLPKDSKQSIKDNLDIVIRDKLIDAINIFPLDIFQAKNHHDEFFHSDLERDYEKYGYRYKGIFETGNPNAHLAIWENEWIDAPGANMFARQMIEHCTKHGMSVLTHLEYNGLNAQKLIRNKSNIKHRDILHRQGLFVSASLKQKYIEKKLKYFGIKS